MQQINQGGQIEFSRNTHTEELFFKFILIGDPGMSVFRAVY